MGLLSARSCLSTHSRLCTCRRVGSTGSPASVLAYGAPMTLVERAGTAASARMTPTQREAEEAHPAWKERSERNGPRRAERQVAGGMRGAAWWPARMAPAHLLQLA